MTSPVAAWLGTGPLGTAWAAKNVLVLTLLRQPVRCSRRVPRSADAFWFVVVALCWGFTNPFIARASKGTEHIRHPNALVQKLLVAKHLLTSWQYVLPLVLNLSGSAIFYATLSHAGTKSRAIGAGRTPLTAKPRP